MFSIHVDYFVTNEGLLRHTLSKMDFQNRSKSDLDVICLGSRCGDFPLKANSKFDRTSIVEPDRYRMIGITPFINGITGYISMASVPDQSQDIIYSIYYEFLDFEQMRRILKPGGYVVIKNIGTRSRLYEQYERWPEMVHRMKQDSLRQYQKIIAEPEVKIVYCSKTPNGHLVVLQFI